MAKFQLQLPDPCTQKWEEMQSTSGGAFCSSCQKEVVDFTEMSEQEIKHFFLNSKGDVCGRLKKKQLDQSYMLWADQSQASWKKYLLAATVMLGIPAYVSAQEATAKISGSMQQEPLLSSAHQSKIIHKPTAISDTLADLKGQVVDSSTGELLPGVSVIVGKSKKGAVTDLDGKFVIEGKLLQSADPIEFSFIGYKSKVFTIEELRANALVALEVDVEVLGEVVLVGGIHVKHWWSPRSLWWKIKGVFR